MDPQEVDRINKLIDSVEKEEKRNETLRKLQVSARKRLFDDDVSEEECNTLEEDDDTVDFLEESDHHTDTEDSADTEDEMDISENRLVPEIIALPQYTGKDKITKWDIHCTRSKGRARRHNIVSHLPGPLNLARNVTSPIESWQLFFPDDMVDKIVHYTNVWIGMRRENYQRPRDVPDTNRVEVKAVIGLLYLAGCQKSSHTNLKDLWALDGTGVELFRTTMSLRRFQFLLTALRFDDFTSRIDRQKSDKFTAFREVWEEFVEHCKSYYSLSEYVTIDEMLDAFRGRCPFRQYIGNKPAKYGLKIFALADARTFYTYNMEVYTGKQPDGPYKVSNSGKDVVERLVQPISGTGRNITTDNWYTSVPLAHSLLANHRLTLVGTIKKNKREIPPIFVQTKTRPEGSSMFDFRNVSTLLSYVPKKNNVVLLLSTMHNSDDIDEESGEAEKPEMLTFYNLTKGGVGFVDKLKASYSVSRTSRRWTLTLFYTLLNVGGINSFIILQNKVDINRRSFFKTLATELCHDYLQYRFSLENIPRRIKQRLRDILGTGREEERPERNNQNPGRCAFCDRRRNRKTKTACANCSLYICREHTVFTCQACSMGTEDEDEENEDDGFIV